MRADAEVVILGAGCAGLSLAAALGQERAPGRRVLLLEPRTEYTRDRTWCFWNTEPHLFATAISHSWHSWRVSHGAREVKRSSRVYRYCHIAGHDFYRDALGRVERAEGQTHLRGVVVNSVARQGDGLLAVETNQGRLLAKTVFDSRPAPGGGAPVLLQRFVGWHVRVAEPCFDPETIELMRFVPSGTPGRAQFLYVLPFSPTEAMVETTYLDLPSLPEPPYTRDLESALRERTSNWEVLYTESGSLPMGGSVTPDETLPGVHRIGTRGGRIKPSSGYAFLRIQRHSRMVAQALKDGQAPPAHGEPGLGGASYRIMDAVFLRALEHAPEEAAALFVRMFAGSEPDALLRFLGETSRGPREVLGVAWSLPKAPMARAALRTGVHALRGALGAMRAAARRTRAERRSAVVHAEAPTTRPFTPMPNFQKQVAETGEQPSGKVTEVAL